jgi:hypothetical protein
MMDAEKDTRPTDSSVVSITLMYLLTVRVGRMRARSVLFTSETKAPCTSTENFSVEATNFS